MSCLAGRASFLGRSAWAKVPLTNSPRKTRLASCVGRIAGSPPSSGSGVAQADPPSHGRRRLFPGTYKLNDGSGGRKDQGSAPRVRPNEQQGQAPEAGGQYRGEAEAV